MIRPSTFITFAGAAKLSLRRPWSHLPLRKHALSIVSTRKYSTPAPRWGSIAEKIQTALDDAALTNPPQLEATVRQVLQTALPQKLYTPKLYEDIINHLLSHQLVPAAMAVYAQMTANGVRPSNTLNATLVSLALLNGTTEQATCLKVLSTTFSDKDFADEDVYPLLILMESLGMSKAQLRALAETFVEAKGEEYQPPMEITAYILQDTPDSDLVQALETISQTPTPVDKFRLRRRLDESPLAKVFEALGSTDIQQVPVARILGLMHEHGIKVDMDVLNNHLATQVIVGLNSGAISTYNLIQRLSTAQEGVTPNPLTFGSLFLLYERSTSPPQTPVRRHHHSEQALLSLPPRVLFRDLWEASNGVPGHLELSVGLLNVALRAFMSRNDYAGAYVVLSSFLQRGIKQDHQTYYSIIKHIIRQIWTDVENDKSDSWTEWFLGARVEDIPLNETTLAIMFHILSRPKFSLDAPLWRDNIKIREDPFAFKMPTMEMIESVPRPHPLDFQYAAEPLKRILRRAILAQLPEISTSADQAVEDAFQEVAVEMTGQRLDIQKGWRS